MRSLPPAALCVALAGAPLLGQTPGEQGQLPTLPLTQLDFIYARHLKPVDCSVPRGPVWARMSDHLPLVTDFALQD